MPDLTCPHCGNALTKRELDCARFDSQVRVSGDCWEWMGARQPFGYGAFGADNRNYSTHRWQWERFNGPIPKGQMVMHTCDNPPCVNPAHLTIGTQRDNMLDKMSKGRHRWVSYKGEAHGRALVTETDVLEMRRLHAEEGWSGLRLATRYGLSRTATYHILRRINWRHI